MTAKRDSAGEVRIADTVPIGGERAFIIFVERMARWWPAEIHVLPDEGCEVSVEPHQGGRWGEQSPAGAALEWGRVLEFEAPWRIVLSWQLAPKPGFDPEIEDFPEVHHDPDMRTDLEVTFTPSSIESCEVVLRHSLLENLGDGVGADMIRELLAGQEVGWPYILDKYVQFTQETDR